MWDAEESIGVLGEISTRNVVSYVNVAIDLVPCSQAIA